MARQHKDSTFTVVVTPAERISLFAKDDIDFKRRTAQIIIEEIRRHVDNVERVELKEDKEFVCSHCGYPWTEDSTIFNGGCCDEDIAQGIDTTGALANDK